MNRDEFMALMNRTDLTPEEMPGWFETVREVLSEAYLKGQTPWEQSGKRGTYADWVRLRLPILECLDKSGSILDVGCANGYLLQNLREWSKGQDLDLELHGLDLAPDLVALARERLPEAAQNLHVGNVYEWTPPQRYDFVRTELVYVPISEQQTYIDRLLSEFVLSGGALIITHYRSEREDRTHGWHDELLLDWGYQPDLITRGFDGRGEECTRAIRLRA